MFFTNLRFKKNNTQVDDIQWFYQRVLYESRENDLFFYIFMYIVNLIAAFESLQRTIVKKLNKRERRCPVYT